MPLYTYTKKIPGRLNQLIKIISLVFILSGLSMVVWVAYPILSFNILYGGKFGEIISPIPNNVSKKILQSELPNIFTPSNEDLTRANAWFPKAVSVKNTNNIDMYFLAIRKIGIEKAVVSLVNDDLTRNLVQFTGPIPGQNGNTVIFGHSTITWLYDTRNYKTIFTKLPELKQGDTMQVTVDNIVYSYKIFEMRIVDPSNLTPLEQQTDDSYLTLITCVPPGTYFKRLVVKGRLISI
jgi:sortase A